MIEAQGFDLLGARTGQFINTQVAIAPRIGFNYDLTGDKSTQIRGGVGVFTSRIPLVWPGGAYNNYGFNIGAYSASNVQFQGDVFKQDKGPGFSLENPTPSGNVDLFAADFKLPQSLKANLIVDKKLGNGLIGSIEALYAKDLNHIFYQNINLRPATRNLEAGPDQRPIYQGV